MLRKKTGGIARGSHPSSVLSQVASHKVDRRGFLRNSGLAVGGIAAVAATSGRVTKAEAQTAAAGGKVEIKKSVCTHCSVGCTVLAEVSNGVWTGQEPAWDSPFNLGAHCAKGAAVREHAPHGVDIYFENVGGAHADAAVNLLNEFGKFVICGQIGDYQDVRSARGPRNFTEVNSKRLRIEGFLIFDYVPQMPKYFQRMGRWLQEGKITWQETVVDGLDSAPQGLLDLFAGKNTGKMLVKLADHDRV